MGEILLVRFRFVACAGADERLHRLAQHVGEIEGILLLDLFGHLLTLADVVGGASKTQFRIMEHTFDIDAEGYMEG